MLRFKKTLLCIVCSLLMLSAFGCNKKIDINKELLLKDSGKYIDCSEFSDELSNTETSLISVKFDSKEEFCDFFKNKTFTSEEKALMFLMSDAERKLQMPNTSNFLGIRFDGEEDIDSIEWYGGNSYLYYGDYEYKDEDLDYYFTADLSAEEIEEFVNERYSNKNYDKKETFEQHYITYTKLTITSPLGYNNTTTYWNISDNGYTYYVRDVSGFAHREAAILIESDLGYGLVKLSDIDDDFDITPEFLKKLTIYSYSIG